MRYFQGLMVFLFLIFSSATIAAQVTFDNFNPAQANQTLTQLNVQLSTQAVTVKDFENAISTLTTLKSQAQRCVNETERALTVVNTQLKAILPTSKQPTPEQQFLQNKKNQLASRLSECRLFVLRSEETISTYTNHAQQLATRQLLEAEPHFFAKVVASFSDLRKLPEQFNKTLFISSSGIQLFNGWTILTLGLLVSLAVVLALKLRSTLKRYIDPEPADIFTKQFSQAFLAVARKYIVIILPLFALSLFLNILDAAASQFSFLDDVSYGLLAYFIALAFIDLIFNPPKPARPLSNFPENITKSFVRRLNLLALLLFFSFVIYILFNDQTFSPSITRLARTLFVTLLAINLISIVWLINRMPRLLYQHPIIRTLLSFILGIGLIVIVAAEWLGYHGIANYLLIGIALTLLSAFATWFIYKISITALNSLSGDHHPWQQHLHFQLGLKRHQSIPELIWLRIVVYTLIWGSFIILLLKIWGLSKSNFRGLIDAILYGFHIAGIPIVLPQILLAFLVFTFLVLLTRWLRQRVNVHPSLEIAPGARAALAAIVGYVGLAFAILFALLVAGVNFAGLAIIAGALSVGIGFGLQNIVNNFVSGIILLIERPVKIGDRIIVGGTEGYVKKISIRSTQIETSQKSNVIVPNSELITGQVINLMYRNLYSRITIGISAIFGSNTELIKNVLLEISRSHPEVISDYPANEPTVVFKQFGESSLDFELSCLIRDVNNQSKVKSDLYFAIDKAFREHDIKLAHPQRDVHIRDWPGLPK